MKEQKREIFVKYLVVKYIQYSSNYTRTKSGCNR